MAWPRGAHGSWPGGPESFLPNTPKANSTESLPEPRRSRNCVREARVESRPTTAVFAADYEESSDVDATFGG